MITDNIIKPVGEMQFDNRVLNVYSSVNEPIFKVSEIDNMLNGRFRTGGSLLALCEEDEKLKLPMIVAGQRVSVEFVTESGLYSILSQSHRPIARKWRRIIHDEIIHLRRQRGLDIIAQFDMWDEALDALYFDEDTGILMQSVTVQGGDVEQRPYEK